MRRSIRERVVVYCNWMEMPTLLLLSANTGLREGGIFRHWQESILPVREEISRKMELCCLLIRDFYLVNLRIHWCNEIFPSIVSFKMFIWDHLQVLTALQHLAWNSADWSKSIGHVHRFLFYVCPVPWHLGCHWRLFLFFCSSVLLILVRLHFLDQESAWCLACILLEEPKDKMPHLLSSPLHGGKAIFMLLNSCQGMLWSSGNFPY